MFSARLPQEKSEERARATRCSDTSRYANSFGALTHRGGAIAHESGLCFVMKRAPAAHLHATRLQSLVNQIACARASNYEKLIHSRVYVTN